MESEIHSGVQAIIALDLKVKSIIQAIANCDSFEALESLNRSAQQQLRNLQSKIRDVEAFVDTEKQNESEQTWLLEQLRNYKQQYEQLSGATRRSVLFKKNELEQSARADLLKGSSDNSEVRSRRSAAAAYETSREVTQRLASLTRILTSQTEQSTETHNHLVGQSQQLVATRDELRTMAGFLNAARALLNKFARRDFTDRVLLGLALLFFFGTVAYIVYARSLRRLVY